MTRDPRYDILFEPVKIGPVTAKNRFYQVPHCNGMGWTQPQALAALRGVKAEGGWAVVSTEEVEIHPTSDCEPFHEGRLWSDADIPALALMADKVHEHAALAAIEIIHQGASCANYGTREVPIAPSHRPITSYGPTQARAMDRQDIRDFRRWHRDAALRSKRAGFDIVYVYAAHGLSLAMQFLQPRMNARIDEYGGSLENRVRLLREVIEDTKDAVGDRCAVAVRLAVDELMGEAGLTSQGEGRDIIEMLAQLPDLWDVNISAWSNDSQTSRFAQEGYQEDYTRFVKSMTTKPVVGVGRFTSPDTMVSQIRRGVLDFIGAARPSIADPFLPKKLEEGREDDIRECIGCNMCVSSDYSSTNLRCTQNPTMGEEWRRGWHPERIATKGSDGAALIVGAGPAGLEAALSAARRGYEVHLAEATAQLGGRVSREAALPGLSEWARVRDWRVGQLNKLTNVHIYRDSRLEAEHVQEFGARHVVVATGALWRRDGVGRENGFALEGFDGASVFTPDDIMAGRLPPGPVVIFDDDHYYMGGVLAERCRASGAAVTLVTPAAMPSAWTANTLEALPIARRLARLGVEVVTYSNISRFADGRVVLVNGLTGALTQREAASVVTVTARLPVDGLYEALKAMPERLSEVGIASLKRIGDCYAPSTIQAAVYAGHKLARELDDAAVTALLPRELPQWVAA
ncbi:MAG TPA: FAD-dependent oxidoreductase [Caulobacteraceae bacterium]|jgi:dimethylamine/trimethylamine dehydrogenase